jgi:hypothetical protein
MAGIKAKCRIAAIIDGLTQTPHALLDAQGSWERFISYGNSSQKASDT